MMKLFRFLIFVLFLGSSAAQLYAQTPATPDTMSQAERRQELADLLKERKEKFDIYTSSLDKRSGFFGNKTKKDITHSNEILVEIVRTDNHIISVLNRVLDYRNFEKVTMNYDIKDRDDRFTQLNNSVALLTKQLNDLNIANANLKTRTNRLRWTLYIVGLLLLTAIYYSRRRRNKTAGQI